MNVFWGSCSKTLKLPAETSNPPTIPRHSYLTPGTAVKFHEACNYLQNGEEAVVVIAEALTKHQAADHVRHSAAQEEGGVKRCGCRERIKCSVNFMYDCGKEKQHQLDYCPAHSVKVGSPYMFKILYVPVNYDRTASSFVF